MRSFVTTARSKSPTDLSRWRWRLNAAGSRFWMIPRCWRKLAGYSLERFARRRLPLQRAARPFTMIPFIATALAWHGVEQGRHALLTSSDISRGRLVRRPLENGLHIVGVSTKRPYRFRNVSKIVINQRNFNLMRLLS